jgi:hypothetical protein
MATVAFLKGDGKGRRRRFGNDACKRRLESANGEGDWKERVDRANGQSERAPFPIGLSIRSFHSPFHSLFPRVVCARRFKRAVRAPYEAEVSESRLRIVGPELRGGRTSGAKSPSDQGSSRRSPDVLFAIRTARSFNHATNAFAVSGCEIA